MPADSRHATEPSAGVSVAIRRGQVTERNVEDAGASEAEAGVLVKYAGWKEVVTVKQRGMAMVVIMVIIGMAGFFALYIYNQSRSAIERTVYNLNDEQALTLAQAALQRTILKVRDEMNDFDLDFQSWFMQFRIPTLTVSGGVSKGFGLAGGAKVNMDLNATPVGSKLYYEHKYNASDLGLDPLIDYLHGRAEIEVKAKIDRAWGIFPEDTDYEIEGITVGTAAITDAVGDFIKSLLPAGSFQIKLDMPRPDIELMVEIEYQGVVIYTVDVASLVGIDKLLNPNKLLDEAGIPTDLEIDFSDLFNNLVDSALDGVLPPQISLSSINIPKPNLCIEKIGDVKFDVTVNYWPYKDRDESKVTRTIQAMKEFKVADLQPLAPLYTFFIGNSSLASKSTEVDPGYAGDEYIDFNHGGVLEVNSFDFKNFVSNIKQLNFPGKMRVNGNKKMTLNACFIGKETGMQGCEIFALLGDEDQSKRKVVPDFRSSYIFQWAWRHWSWPHMGTPNSWFTIPTAGTENNRTHAFGTLFLNGPLGFKVEGNLVQKFRQWDFLYIKPFWIYTPFGAYPIPPFPIVMWKTAYKDKNLSFAPGEFASNAGPTPYNPNDPQNLPPNLYSLDQYLNKASYLYPSGNDFISDLPNRCDESGHFIIDGVNFIADSVRLPDLTVKGKGMIVSAGNVYIAGNIRQADDDNTVFSIIARQGSLVHTSGNHTVEAACYANEGISTNGDLKIKGNLVVNKFNKSSMGGLTKINFVASNTRMSLTSLLPGYGKYDPIRYYITMGRQFSVYKEAKKL